jgi:LPS O-antigen subunit length determinant protein (WzzB/FepE family)
MSEEDRNMSALEENISKKGNNAYYYAHGKKIDGPAWDGKEEPRFLGTATVTTATKEFVNTLDTFSWLDDDKYVKIYVEYEGAGAVADEDIKLVRYMQYSYPPSQWSFFLTERGW